MALPDEILDLIEMHPIEDLVLTLLRERITSVPVQSQIYDDQTFPAIVIHRGDILGDWWGGDPRFIDHARLDVFCFTEGLNGDEDGSLLSEAVRVVLRDSINKVVPGRGHLTEVIMTSAPRNAADWDTATGPVQYADLPTEVVRYSTSYALSVRKPNA
jgi:hypothetical protein